jgi:HK97 gp10 family phage protein
MKVDIKTEGFADLERELQRIGTATAQKASLRRALRKAAVPMAAAAFDMAPDDPSTTSKDLRASIGIGTKLTPRQARMHRKMFKNDRAAVEMFVGAGNVPQAHLQEFGTSHHPAQPFMRPAFDQEAMPTLDRLKAEIRADIQKVLARQARRAARAAGG